MWNWQQREIDQYTAQEDLYILCRDGAAAFAAADSSPSFLLSGHTPLNTRWEERSGTVHRFQSEIFMQLQGGCTFTLPGRTIELMPGQILLVPPGTPHLEKSNNYGGTPFLNIVLSTYWMESSLHVGISGSKRKPIIAGQRFRLPDADLYRSLAQALSAWPQSGDSAPLREGRERLLQSLLLKLSGDLASPLPLFPETSPGSGVLARRLYELLNHDFSACLASVAELAARLKCSPNHLSRSFPKAYGMTISDYTLARRLDHARELLQKSNLSAAEAAEICGFHDRSYFARRFRERFGSIPSRFR